MSLVDVPQSLATKSLGQVNGVLKTTNDILINAHPPIAELVVVINKLDGYITEALNFTGFIDDILKILHEALQICKYLGELIPEIGPIIADGATAIEKLGIEQTVRKVLDDMKQIVKKAQDGVVRDIKVAANNVSSHLEAVLHDLPSWSDTVGIMEKLFGLTDIFIYLFFKDEKDELIAKAMAALHDMSSGAFDKISAVKNALEPIKNFIQQTWNKFKEAILKPLQEGFENILKVLRPVMGVVQDCINACSKIKQWFEPFFWVLNAIQWIFEHTVGWLIDKVLNELGLRALIQKFVDYVMKVIGVESIKNNLHAMLETTLGEISKPLKEIGVDSIKNTVKEFAQILQGFKSNPSGVLLTVVQNAIVGRNFNEPNPWFDLDTETEIPKPVSFLAAVPLEFAAADFGSTRLAEDHTSTVVKEVEKTQVDIDDFIEKAGSNAMAPPVVLFALSNTSADIVPTSNSTLPSEPPQARPVSAPKLGYATHDAQPVSVLMRVTHKRVLGRQLDARTKPLAPMATIPDEHPKPTMAFSVLSANAAADTITTSPSSGKSPNFDVYTAKYANLLGKIKTANIHLDRMKEAAKQADADFATYTSEAADFCDHFTSMLGGLDPVLDAVTNVLGLLLKYKNTLTVDLDKVVKNAGLPDAVRALTPLLFTTIDKSMSVIEKFHGLKTKVQEDSTKVSAAYHTFHAHVAQVCSPDRFPKTLGPNVSSLSSLITALQNRLDSSANCFTFVNKLGQTIFQNQDKLDGNKDEVFTKLDRIYASLNHVVDSTITEIESFPAQVGALYDALVATHADVQVFFNAAHTISEQCRVVEAKIIAADRVRGLCNRINNAVVPFMALLDQLGVHVDPPSDGGPPSGGEPLSKVMKIFDGLATALLSEAVFPRIDALLGHFFNLSVVDDKMAKLKATLLQPFEDHLKSFDAVLRDLLKRLEPKQTNTFAVPTNPTGGSPASSTFLVSNPLLDESTAQTLGAILQEVTKLAHGITLKDGDNPTENSIRIPRWARHDVNEQPIKDMYLLTWGRTWDEAEPMYPSRVFINWYSLLEHLDRLMRQRQKWQRLDAHAPLPVPPPATLASSKLDLWKLLEEKAIIGGSQYEGTIVKPLQKHLHDRINQLFNGVVQLPPEAAANDILKLLPPPKEGQFPPYWSLPSSAVDLASSAFDDKKIPDTLAEVFAEQEKFEGVAVNLRPLFSAAGSIFAAANTTAEAGIAALAGIHDDYNLMDARKLLELTGEESKAKDFANLAGSGERLK